MTLSVRQIGNTVIIDVAGRRSIFPIRRRCARYYCARLKIIERRV